MDVTLSFDAKLLQSFPFLFGNGLTEGCLLDNDYGRCFHRGSVLCPLFTHRIPHKWALWNSPARAKLVPDRLLDIVRVTFSSRKSDLHKIRSR
ncbi:hypothetical protein D3C72_2228750 [compost metagenome]